MATTLNELKERIYTALNKEHTKATINEIVDELFIQIKSSLYKNNDVVIMNFGRFRVQEYVTRPNNLCKEAKKGMKAIFKTSERLKTMLMVVNRNAKK